MVEPIVAYLVGSIPAGYLIARLAGVADIRNHGSGNIGATNVSRLLGWPFFVLVFLVDAGKSFSCIYLASFYHLDLSLMGLGLLAGNGYSIFLDGTGGKGVATTFGIILGLAPLFALFFALQWLVSIIIFSYPPAFASINAVWTIAIFAVMFQSPYMALFLLIALFVSFQHRANFAQLRQAL